MIGAETNMSPIALQLKRSMCVHARVSWSIVSETTPICSVINDTNYVFKSNFINTSSIARFIGPTWGPSGANRTQVGPMLAPWTLLSGLAYLLRQHALMKMIMLPKCGSKPLCIGVHLMTLHGSGPHVAGSSVQIRHRERHIILYGVCDHIINVFPVHSLNKWFLILILF